MDSASAGWPRHVDYLGERHLDLDGVADAVNAVGGGRGDAHVFHVRWRWICKHSVARVGRQRCEHPPGVYAGVILNRPASERAGAGADADAVFVVVARPARGSGR